MATWASQVPDLRAAIDTWVTVHGAGPFYLLEHWPSTSARAAARLVEWDHGDGGCGGVGDGNAYIVTRAARRALADGPSIRSRVRRHGGRLAAHRERRWLRGGRVGR